MTATCWLNGRLVEPAQAQVSVFDHGLLYGDGVFEGIRFYDRRPFRLEQHLRRLQDSANAIMLRVPYSCPELTEAVTEVIQAHQSADGYLRLVVTRGPGSLGIDPVSCGEPNVFIIADRCTLLGGDEMRDGITLMTASTRQVPADVLDPGIKSLNYLNKVLARIEARNAGADEAVLLNQQGKVTECSTENLFIVKDGVLLTPRCSDGTLRGITRQVLLELAGELGIAYRKTSLCRLDLYSAQECFVSGTGAELVAVKSVDGRPLPECPGSRFKLLSAAFRRKVTAECLAP